MTGLVMALKTLLRPLLSEFRWFRRWHGGRWGRMVPFAEESWPVSPTTPPQEINE